MFCPQCGQAIEEGKSFCRFCGAKIAGDATVVAPRAQAPGATPPAPAPAPPAGGAAPYAGQESSPVWTPTPPAPPPGWGPDGDAGPDTPRRTLWVILAVLGALIILGGGGAAAYYFLIRDDSKGTTTTSVVTSTTLPGTTVTGGTTTTRLATTSVTTGTGGGTTSTTGSKPTTTTKATTTTTAATAYVQAVTALEKALQQDDSRIPQLADTINATAPNVPQSVYDELSAMNDHLAQLIDQLTSVDPPEKWIEADGLILDASQFMQYRIQSTMDGIQAMWDQGTVDAATYYFDEGRAARDQFRSSFDQYLKAKP